MPMLVVEVSPEGGRLVMRRVTLLAAMLVVMVMMTAAPAFAQIGGAAVGIQHGHGNVQSVQNAVQQQAFGVQVNQFGDNVNVQAISQVSNINTGVVVVLIH